MKVDINKIRSRFFILASSLVVMASSLHAGQNLIVNGGFESSGDIGSAEYKKICDGANLGAWKALRTYNVGLVNVQKAQSWRLNQNVRGEAGKYVVYMQVTGDAGDLSLIKMLRFRKQVYTVFLQRPLRVQTVITVMCTPTASEEPGFTKAVRSMAHIGKNLCV